MNTENDTPTLARPAPLPPPDARPDADLKLDREVMRLLRLHRGAEQWRVIERETGVSISWMAKFTSGKITNPGYRTLKRIYVLLSDKPVIRKRPLTASSWAKQAAGQQ